MGLNASKVMGKRKEVPVLPIATYPGYFIQVLDMGLHPNVYKGEDKGPARKIRLTYELGDEYLTDDEGQPDPSKPRWISEEMWLFSLKSERATSTARLKTLDPNNVHGGDFIPLLGTPVNISIGQRKATGKWEGRLFNEVLGISGMRPKDAANMKGPVNKPTFLDLDDPDMEVFNSLPEFVKNTIKSDLEFTGSPLSKLLENVKESVPAKAQQPEMDEEEGGDSPY